jgi:hypothetical protein
VVDNACQLLDEGLWYSMKTPLSPINKTDSRKITEILLKVALSIDYK